MSEVVVRPRELLYNTILRMNYGDIITHREIEAILGITRESQKYYNTIMWLSPRLTLQAKHIVSVNRIGYKVCTPREYAEEVAKKAQRGKRAFQRGKTISDYTPTHLLTQAEAQRHSDVAMRIQSACIDVDRICIEINVATRRNPALLPENVGRP